MPKICYHTSCLKVRITTTGILHHPWMSHSLLLCSSPPPLSASTFFHPSQAPWLCPAEHLKIAFPQALGDVVLHCLLQGAPGSPWAHPSCPHLHTLLWAFLGMLPQTVHQTTCLVVLVLLLPGPYVVWPLWNVSFRTRTVQGPGTYIAQGLRCTGPYSAHPAQPKKATRWSLQIVPEWQVFDDRNSLHSHTDPFANKEIKSTS